YIAAQTLHKRCTNGSGDLMADIIFEEAQSINDRTLKALAREKAPEGKRVEIRDANHPGFIVNVNDRGKITFLVNDRFPGQKSSSRRTIGIYGTETDSDAGIFTLASARAEAERWRNEVRKGNDPKAERERRAEEIRRAEQAQQRQQAGTVEKAIEEFVRVK